jgi:cellulose biosynthesis protein BcsQ
LHRELVDRLQSSEPALLRTAIPNASAVERMGVERAPVAAYAPRSAAAKAFAELWAEVFARLWP